MRSLRRLSAALMVCLLAVIMLGAAPDEAARFGRIGHNMMCVCGCGQILLECNHVGCPDSDRMIGELRDELSGPNGAGADSLILNWFVAKYGGTVLAAPMRGGFDVVAWVVPISVFILAIFGTGWMVRVWYTRRHALAGGAPAGWTPELSGEDQARRDRVRRDTEYR